MATKGLRRKKMIPSIEPVYSENSNSEFEPIGDE